MECLIKSGSAVNHTGEFIDSPAVLNWYLNWCPKQHIGKLGEPILILKKLLIAGVSLHTKDLLAPKSCPPRNLFERILVETNSFYVTLVGNFLITKIWDNQIQPAQAELVRYLPQVIVDLVRHYLMDSSYLENSTNRLIKKSSSSFQPEEKASSDLERAVQDGRVDTVKLLIESKAEVAEQNDSGMTVLDYGQPSLLDSEYTAAVICVTRHLYSKFALFNHLDKTKEHEAIATRNNEIQFS